MDKKMKYEEFAPKFGRWAERFKPFIESEDFYNIYQKIKNDAFYEKDGKLFRKEFIVPDSENTFRTFQLSDPSEVKVIWYLMDPYPRRYINKAYQATGIALDCFNSPDGKLQPSLKKFYDAMSKEVGKKVEFSPSLVYLLQQGNLMLNTDFTCKLGKTGSHEGLWLPFQKYFLQEVMGAYSGIIYVLCGKSSHKLDKLIYPVGNYIFKIEHPAAAEHTNRDWNSDGIFRKINEILKNNNGIMSKIFWDKAEWDEEPPF